MRSIATLATVVLLCAMSLYAQDPLKDSIEMPTHLHSMEDPALIDGSQHPELIPDSTAYRLFFLVASQPPNPNSVQKARENAILHPLQLGANDQDTMTTILTKFRIDYQQLVDNYNRSVEEANMKGVSPDLKTFLQQRERLVQYTRDALATSLPADAATRLHDHIQREKAKMKVHVEEGQ